MELIAQRRLVQLFQGGGQIANLGRMKNPFIVRRRYQLQGGIPNASRKRGEKLSTQQHLRIFDVWKGLCILCILITHFNWSNHSRLVLLFPFWVDMAVPVFMMISGYLYAVSLERQHMVALEDAYRNVFVVRKMVRYAVPFTLVWLFELVYDYAIRHAEISVGG